MHMTTRDADLAAQAAWLAERPPSTAAAADWGIYEPQRQILLAACCSVAKAPGGGYVVDGIRLSAAQMVCRARRLAKGQARWQRVKGVGL